MINKHRLIYQGVLWAGFTLLSLTIISCSWNSLDKLALGISKMSQLRSAELKGGKFILRVYYRFDQPGAPLHVYLEGDGRAWLSRYRASHNPTPRNPVALSLAARDYADNVMYIARPCQYVSFEKNPDCKYPYWTHKRFAPEVIDSVSAVIDLGKKKAKARDLEMIGFSGGGAVAILVSAQRRDVTGIRTVAGNLNHKVWRKVLSDREIEISGLVSHEFTNYQIGEKLNISETTVKTHLRNIYSKTGIHDRATLAIRILNSDKT